MCLYTCMSKVIVVYVLYREWTSTYRKKRIEIERERGYFFSLLSFWLFLLNIITQNKRVLILIIFKIVAVVSIKKNAINYRGLNILITSGKRLLLEIILIIDLERESLKLTMKILCLNIYTHLLTKNTRSVKIEYTHHTEYVLFYLRCCVYIFM